MATSITTVRQADMEFQFYRVENQIEGRVYEVLDGEELGDHIFTIFENQITVLMESNRSTLPLSNYSEDQQNSILQSIQESGDIVVTMRDLSTAQNAEIHIHSNE